MEESVLPAPIAEELDSKGEAVAGILDQCRTAVEVAFGITPDRCGAGSGVLKSHEPGIQLTVQKVGGARRLRRRFLPGDLCVSDDIRGGYAIQPRPFSPV